MVYCRNIFDVLRYLVPFARFKKREGVLLLVLHQGSFSRFWNCTVGTKSRNASHYFPVCLVGLELKHPKMPKIFSFHFRWREYFREISSVKLLVEAISVFIFFSFLKHLGQSTLKLFLHRILLSTKHLESHN